MRNYFLLISDLQTKILPHISNSNSIINNTNLLLESRKFLPNIKKTYCAQILPEKLGPITPDLNINENVNILNKKRYSLYSDDIYENLVKDKVSDIILTGVETPWCIAQTAIDFINKDINVHIPYDAVGCQNENNNFITLKRLETFGSKIATTNGLIAECIPDVDNYSAKWFIKNYK
jgi:isochorismate hydrolase